MLSKKYSCFVSGSPSTQQCGRNGVAQQYLMELPWITHPGHRLIRKMHKALVWGTASNIFCVCVFYLPFRHSQSLTVWIQTWNNRHIIQTESPTVFSRADVNHLKLILLVRNLLILRLFCSIKTIASVLTKARENWHKVNYVRQ